MPAVGAFPLDVPVDPDAPEARRWLIEESRSKKYNPPAETPSWLRDWLRGIQEWFESLFNGVSSPASSPVWLVVLLVIAAAVIVVAFLIFGVPRLNRRSRERGELFGEDDERDSATLRRAATRAAEAGDFATAIAEMFRALARGLSERTIVTTSPGTTAHGFVREAGDGVPGCRGASRDGRRRLRPRALPGCAGHRRAMGGDRRPREGLRSAKPVHDEQTAAAVMW